MHFEQHELHGNLMKGFLNGNPLALRALGVRHPSVEALERGLKASKT